MSRYFHLMALAATEVFFKFPIALFGTISMIRSAPLKPWISWADTHQHSGQVRFTSYDLFSAQLHAKNFNNLGRWEDIGGAFLFFIFFGLSGEARQDYKRVFWQIMTPLGIKPPAPKPQDSGWCVYLANF
jgi:pheromone a factor receptor